MSRKPALFNEALAGFFRSTASVAEKRAESASVDARAAPAVEPNPLADRPAVDPGTDSEWLAEPGHGTLHRSEEAS
jgi:hypothetical protein